MSIDFAAQLRQSLILDRGRWPTSYRLRLGLEGIVSTRLGSPYRSGRSRHWIKSKNPKHPAVKQEAEEE